MRIQGTIVGLALFALGTATACHEAAPATTAAPAHAPPPATAPVAATAHADAAPPTARPIGEPPGVPSIQIGAIVAGGPLPAEAIKKVVNDHIAEADGCFTDLTHYGTVTVTFTIATDGSTRDVTVTNDLAPAIGTCLAKLAGTFRFPPVEAGARQTVSIPYELVIE